MPRPMSSDMLTALQAGILRPALFVQAQFNTGYIYLWSGRGSISWNGHTWSGVGSLIAISVIEDAAGIEARGISISLSGIDNSLLGDVLQEFKAVAPVVVYFGLFDAGGSLLSSPLTAWAGRMDQPAVDVGADTSVITVNCENRLLEMNVAVDRRYTHEDQQLAHPGDLGFQFVNSIQEMNIYWGRVPSSSNNV